MTAMPERKTWTVDEYLAYDEASIEKSEYNAGDVYMMAGASENHNLIAGNTITALNIALRERQCRVYPSDMRIKVSEFDSYFYPDLSVACGERQIERKRGESLLNPLVIFEILSPTSEGYDRGRKFHAYRALASVQAYGLIAQDHARIELFVRQPNDQWLLTDAVGLAASIRLEALDCVLELADVYARVEFTDAADEP